MNIFEFTANILDKNDAIEFLREREILRADPPHCTNNNCDVLYICVKNKFLF